VTIRKPNKYTPDNTSHPGETLREMLKERGVTQTAFASQLGIANSYLCDVLNCRRGVSTKTALRLEKALDVSAEFWLTLQMNHDLASARKEHGYK
jgi:addiction module HigA family antidote